MRNGAQKLQTKLRGVDAKYLEMKVDKQPYSERMADVVLNSFGIERPSKNHVAVLKDANAKHPYSLSNLKWVNKSNEDIIDLILAGKKVTHDIMRICNESAKKILQKRVNVDLQKLCN